MSDLEHESLLRVQREQATRDIIDSSRDDVPPTGGKAQLLATLDLAGGAETGRGSSLGRALEGRSAYLVGLALVVGAGVTFVSSRAESPQLASAPLKSAATLVAPADMAASPRVVAPAERTSIESPPAEPSAAGSAARTMQRPRSTPSEPSKAGEAANAPRIKPRAESTLGREVARMSAARSSLAAGEAARTLEILDSYESEFLQGAFAIEVSVLRVEALAKSGRMDEARRLGERFLQQHPHGLFANRVASTLGIVTDSETAPAR